MKKSLISFCLLVSALTLSAQNGELKSDFDFSKFPEVSFTWHEYNPITVSSAKFSLKENGEEVPLSVTLCDKDAAWLDQVHRSIVFLWEDMGCNSTMFSITQNILLDYANHIADDSEDEYMVATFNRQTHGQDVLNIRTNGFIRSSRKFAEAVQHTTHSTATYSEETNKSDVFQALNEALAKLHQRDNEVKSIILFTAGRPLESSATTSVVMVQQLALKYHIPIYVVQYTRSYGKSVKLEALANDTYGNNFVLDDAYSNVNIHNGSVKLRYWDTNLKKLWRGNDYQITFTSTAPRNQQSTKLDLDVNGNPYTIQMPAVGYTFGSWIKYHIWQSCLILLGLLIAIALIVFFSVKKSKKTTQEMNRLREEQEKANELAQQHANRIAQMQEESRKAQIETLKAKAQQEEDELLNLMHSKNLYPHLQYETVDGERVVYEIRKVVTFIGRDTAADMPINNKTVSRKHARIVFNGVNFTIEDLKSTNGTIVGGVPVSTPQILHDHDIINLGSALITYYL